MNDTDLAEAIRLLTQARDAMVILQSRYADDDAETELTSMAKAAIKAASELF